MNINYIVKTRHGYGVATVNSNKKYKISDIHSMCDGLYFGIKELAVKRAINIGNRYPIDQEVYT